VGWERQRQRRELEECGEVLSRSSIGRILRLATIDELQGIYDKTANAPGLAGKRAVTWHVQGNLFLTGHPWSSHYRTDDRGRNSGYSWFFNFNDGQSDNDPSGFPYPSSKRALCVRSFGK
jgi:hypothetical protein